MPNVSIAFVKFLPQKTYNYWYWHYSRPRPNSGTFTPCISGEGFDKSPKNIERGPKEIPTNKGESEEAASTVVVARALQGAIIQGVTDDINNFCKSETTMHVVDNGKLGVVRGVEDDQDQEPSQKA
jgi:hypothetical protein